MDVAPVQKVSYVPDVGSATRPPIHAGGAPVATELAASASVQQASAGYAAGNDVQRSPPDAAPSVERHLTIDTETHQIVSQVIAQQSGDILSQVPDQALLRVKTYAREIVAKLDQAQARHRRDA